MATLRDIETALNRNTRDRKTRDRKTTWKAANEQQTFITHIGECRIIVSQHTHQNRQTNLEIFSQEGDLLETTQSPAAVRDTKMQATLAELHNAARRQARRQALNADETLQKLMEELEKIKEQT